MTSLVDFLRDHFWHVAPILAAAVIATAIILERFQALILRYPMRGFHGFFEKIRDLVLADRVSDAVALCDQFGSKPSAQVAKEGLLRAHQPDELIENGLEYALAESMDQIQRRTQFLNTIANVSTLLGLLGTIAGLITAFQAVSHADAQQKSALLAEGISTAMNATMLGLGVAVPCMVAFGFLMNRTNRLGSEVERAAIRTLDILRQRAYAVEYTGGSKPGQGGVKKAG